MNQQTGKSALQSHCYKYIVGRVYESFLSEPSGAISTTGTVARGASASDSASQFASADGKKGGQVNYEFRTANDQLNR